MQEQSCIAQPALDSVAGSVQIVKRTAKIITLAGKGRCSSGWKEVGTYTSKGTAIFVPFHGSNRNWNSNQLWLVLNGKLMHAWEPLAPEGHWAYTPVSPQTSWNEPLGSRSLPRENLFPTDQGASTVLWVETGTCVFKGINPSKSIGRTTGTLWSW
jgi:hypothetical protein